MTRPFGQSSIALGIVEVLSELIDALLEIVPFDGWKPIYPSILSGRHERKGSGFEIFLNGLDEPTALATRVVSVTVRTAVPTTGTFESEIVAHSGSMMSSMSHSSQPSPAWLYE